MVSVLQRMKVNPADVVQIWSQLTDPLSIYDVELKTKITFLYSQYCHYNEEIRKEIDIVCDNLDDVDFDKMESVDNVDNEQLALSRFLDVYPFLLGLTNYSQYGLNVYEFDTIVGNINKNIKLVDLSMETLPTDIKELMQKVYDNNI